MILRAAASTDVGLRRKENEDRYALSPELGLYLVADGMGGHTAGQVASRLAAETALEAIQTLEGAAASLAERLRYAVAAANRAIYTKAQEESEYAGMGTTLVAFLADGARAALAHVGDSRAYLIRARRIRQLTDDHSIVGELLRRREISEDAAREHPHRHVLTRALGVRRLVGAVLGRTDQSHRGSRDRQAGLCERRSAGGLRGADRSRQRAGWRGQQHGSPRPLREGRVEDPQPAGAVASW
jgi:protein phosphatase